MSEVKRRIIEELKRRDVEQPDLPFGKKPEPKKNIQEQLPEGAIGWARPGIPLYPKDDEDPRVESVKEWQRDGHKIREEKRRRYN